MPVIIILHLDKLDLGDVKRDVVVVVAGSCDIESTT